MTAVSEVTVTIRTKRGFLPAALAHWAAQRVGAPRFVVAAFWWLLATRVSFA